MKRTILTVSVLAVAAATAAPPVVSHVSVSLQGRRLAVSYDLSDEAVVTADALTNVTGTASGESFASVGAAFRSVSGDIARVVPAGPRTFFWRLAKDLPRQSFPSGSLKVRVTAWSLDDKPDYMVVDLATGAVSYYSSAELVPGGILDEAYRTKKLALRRIRARGVEWQMGSYGEIGNYSSYEPADRAHFVTLDHDYYLGVFEMTREQVGTMCNYAGESWTGTLPHTNVCFADIRRTHYPEAIPSGTYLDALRTRTGIDFDLPSEAEWEYACRAGHGEEEWSDGSTILGDKQDANLDRLAHYGGNNGPGGWVGAVTNAGSKAANDWGLYDMHGNVREWCLDWYQTDITARADGRANASGLACLDGTTRAESDPVVVRGGCYASDAKDCRAARRESQAPDTWQWQTGWRIACRNGL